MIINWVITCYALDLQLVKGHNQKELEAKAPEGFEFDCLVSQAVVY